jgi:hypothetical protein
MAEKDRFAVKFSHRGKSATVGGISREITAPALLAAARTSLGIEDDDGVFLRLIFKGRTIAREAVDEGDVGGDGDSDGDEGDGVATRPAFPAGATMPKNGGIATVMVVGGATTASGIREINSSRSDPLIRGFDHEISARRVAMSSAASSAHWGPSLSDQDSRYKFCRLEECADASFGSRPGASTPHAFEARRLLERLATDPGIVAILRSRELVVGTLGEMDPVDDRIMQKMQQGGGGCLLGYNTNHGLRIDVKLRTDDLSGFRPYRELASTLIHELSHNWVGEHDALFWTNYGQMRVEYLWRHARLMRGGAFVGGKRTAALAGIVDMILPGTGDGNIAPSSSSSRGGGSNNALGDDSRTMNDICRSVINELATEMAQHRLPAQLVAPAVLTFGRELMSETNQDDPADGTGGHRLGGTDPSSSSGRGGDHVDGTSARERALAAAEKRAREAKDKPKDKSIER